MESNRKGEKGTAAVGERSIKMAILRSAVLFVSISTLWQTTQGYYCDYDKCKDEEFCCGENICCVSYKVWELWYFWCGILFCMFLLSLCACFWRQRSRAYWVFRSPAPYSPLTTEPDNKYVPVRPDTYVTAGDMSHSDNSSFYSKMQQKQSPSWYTAHTGHQEVPPPYSDNDTGQKIGF